MNDRISLSALKRQIMNGGHRLLGESGSLVTTHSLCSHGNKRKYSLRTMEISLVYNFSVTKHCVRACCTT